MQTTLYNKLFTAPTTDVAYMQNMVQQHPYFAVAQYFLLKNKATTAVDYNETAAKTALFFDNPFLLQAQLNDIATKINDTIIATTPVAAPVINDAVIETPTEVTITETANQPQPFLPKLSAKEPLLFEPLHASDYFASQGIKLSAEMLKDDKLGMQLKSFTSWLKTMKKVHTDKLPEVSKQIEKAVQSQAEKSNKEDEIVTEAMAVAYEQQGKNQRAIDIYSKLSLINPAKNTYFAAKIESLKK